MSQWARNPPSMKRVKFMLAIIAIVALLAGYEHFFGWPEALSTTRAPRVPRLP